uniref:Uncharacterized protein n=1 Tax=Arundo donax TaxID=35708 RepID=A0A0A9GSH2_ARUDO
MAGCHRAHLALHAWAPRVAGLAPAAASCRGLVSRPRPLQPRVASSAPVPTARRGLAHRSRLCAGLALAAALRLRLVRRSCASRARPPPLPRHGLGPRHCRTCYTSLARAGVVRGHGEEVRGGCVAMEGEEIGERGER